MPEDNSYLNLYLVESRENHENIVKNLLQLEKEARQEIVDEIFRSAHTLKGMSASMGFFSMERLCHAMEDILSEIRDGLLKPEKGLVDDLLACTDYIEKALEEIEGSGQEMLPEPAELISRLMNWLGRNPDVETPSGEGQNAPYENGEDGQPSIRDEQPLNEGKKYRIRVKLDDKCTAKYLRGMVILQNLDLLGRVIECSPSREEIEGEGFGGEFEALIESDAGIEAIRASISCADVASAAVDPLGTQVKDSSRTEIPVKAEPRKRIDNEESQSEQKNREIRHLRVDIKRLDQMMNLVEDLVLNAGRIRQIANKHRIPELEEALGMTWRSISDLQDLVMRIRMIPLNHLFNRFPRVVRDVAQHDGKEVELIITGGDVDLDRTVIDGLNDPLLHLIRNAVNHGIETPAERIAAGKNPRGTVRLSARRERDNVFIVVEDDGRGIDEERVRKKAIERGLVGTEEAEKLSKEEIIEYIFQPGFSTADKVTDISGRGVGLDVVRKTIESMKGSVRVESERGRGTRFELSLPPSMAIVDVLLVRINGRRCAIPVHNVLEVANMKSCLVRRAGNSEVVVLRDEVIPLHRLEEMFGKNGKDEILFVIQNHQKRFMITVGEVEGQQQVVIKPLNLVFGKCHGISGVTILGDGEVIPVLDVNNLIQR